MQRFYRLKLPHVLYIALLPIIVLFSAITLPTSPAHADTPTPVPVEQLAVEVKTVATGFKTPVTITNAKDGSNRIFVIEKVGRIRILLDGTVVDKPFLDISPLVNSGSNERGLLGLAFHPNYKQNGLFFVYYTAENGAITIARYHVSTDANVADPDSAKIILKQPHQRANHNGGQLVFGPDGFLYTGFGDGGGADDPDHNGQNPFTLLGKLLRLDIDTEDPYGIPADNPFAQNGKGHPEVWAYGLRNPWRFSFDRLTGDLYIGDVGQDTFEEVDFQKAGTPGGVNYGWNKMEGTHCFQGAATSCDPSLYQLPVIDYSHSDGCSVTGGYVYRGPAFPAMQGTYFYSDYCSGTLWGLQSINGQWHNAKLLPSVGSISTFGEDEAGEIYLADIVNGTIYQIVQKNG